MRAILAGGMVLGIGAAVTLASWNDGDYASTTFTAGRFDIVGSTDGTTFTSHPASGPAALTFSLSADASALAPGKTVYALFSVKTVNSSVAGTVTIVAGTPSGTVNGTVKLADILTYGVRSITGTACSSGTDYTSAGSVAVIDEGVLLSASQTKPALALAANGGSQVNYCFAITMPAVASNDAQGLTLTQTWQFAATSS